VDGGEQCAFHPPGSLDYARDDEGERMKRASAKTIERVRKICLAFPDTFEKLSHGEPTWFCGGGKGRVFAMLSNNHHDDDNVAIVCNAPEGAQQALVDAEPEHIYRPPYVGGAGWIGVRLDTGLDWKMIAALIGQAYDTTLAAAKSRKRAR
jgi:hypothetical protein